jgi:hypothetical protein
MWKDSLVIRAVLIWGRLPEFVSFLLLMEFKMMENKHIVGYSQRDESILWTWK